MRNTKLHFFRIFSHKFKHWIIWNCYIANIILLSLKYLFWGYSKWPQIKQSVPGLNRGLSIIFLFLRSAIHPKFTKDYVIYVVACFSQKNVDKWSKYGFAPTSLHQKDSPWCENTDSPVKKVRQMVFWDKKGPLTHDFFEKKYNSKQCFPLPTPKAKFTLFLDWLIYIYEKVYLGSIFSFKDVWLNKIESLLFWSFFFFLSRVLMFFVFFGGGFNLKICQRFLQSNYLCYTDKNWKYSI